MMFYEELCLVVYGDQRIEAIRAAVPEYLRRRLPPPMDPLLMGVLYNVGSQGRRRNHRTMLLSMNGIRIIIALTMTTSMFINRELFPSMLELRKCKTILSTKCHRFE